jgi:subfamily B ATP-binding cassette protein MsbA
VIPSEVKRIWQELKLHRGRLTTVAVFGLLMAFADSASAKLIKDVFDALQAANTDLIKSTIWIIVGLAALKAVSRYLHIFNMNYVSELVVQGLRQKLQSKFMNLNLTFHNSYASCSGGLISRLFNDLVVIQNSLRMYADFFREPWLLVALIVWLFVLDWKLTAWIIVVLPLILLFLRQMSKGIKKHSIQGQEELERITSTIKESLDGVRVIQSFNLQNEMSSRFVRESQNFLASRRRIHRLIESSSPVTEFVMTVLIMGIILYMTLQISSGHATYGDFMSYVASLFMMSAPIKKLQESYVRVQETAVAAKRTFALLDEKSEVPQAKATKSFPKNWKQITFQNVSFRYGEDWILRNINLTVSRGEIIAFVGASGSGKSTLVNLIGRFFDPSEGKILIDDISIDEIKLEDLRANVALVTQDVFLFSDTVERNIWAGNFTKENQTVELAARNANAHNFIQKMPGSYQYRVGDRGNLLSGGEKQRISIARAIFKDAPILILDEATSALDSASETEVQKGLDTLMEGRTAFVIAHRLSTVAKANRIFVLKSGQIVESGSHQTLLEKQGEYFQLHQLQYNH